MHEVELREIRMTTSGPAQLNEIDSELALIRWRHEAFNRITETVEAALPDLMAEIDRTVAGLSVVAAGKAQIWPDRLWNDIFEPWAQKTAHQVESEMVEFVDTIATSLAETGTGKKIFQLALPTLARAGVLAASLAAIPSVVSLATVTTTTFVFFSTPVLSLPLLAVGAGGLALATFTGSRVADRLSDRNRRKLVVHLQGRARTAALGHGLVSGARCVVNDLQAATMRRLEVELEQI
jgi:hypothetical protein